MSPRRLFTTLALAEAITWALLLTGMALKYLTRTTELGVQLAGPVHGFVFLAFCLATVLLAVDARWTWRRTATGLLAGVVPFATVPFERSTDRAGLLPESWRLREEPGTGALERLLGRALRAPLLTTGAAVVVVVAVFAVLLALGPPTEGLTGPG